MIEKEIIPVSQYLDRLNTSLKSEKAKIIGEVTGVQMYEGRSYLFFSIKDSKDGSTVRCFMWKNDYKISGVTLKDGMEIVITAYPAIHKQYGFSLQVEMAEVVGEGALQLAYEKLKKQLELEGLFSPLRKRAIPQYPCKIGVITSKSGAVINDFLTNIGKFGFHITFVDSKVEGQDATKDLLAAVETMKNQDIDILVLMRGGGSLESFQAFNNEVLIRAVADFPVPVLTGIGHDKDEPLISLVSDKNVSTPTAVANLLSSGWSEALSLVRLGEERIFGTYQAALRDSQFQIDNSDNLIQGKFSQFLETFHRAEQTLLRSVDRIEAGISRVWEKIDMQTKELSREFSLMYAGIDDHLIQVGKVIESYNPERQLKHGYSIVRSKGKVLKSIKDAEKGEKLDITLSDGIINSQII